MIVGPCNSAGTIPPGAQSIEGTWRVLEMGHLRSILRKQNPFG